jgi:pimeloyl-ACP methyl ester carboxylesterase
LAASLLFYDSSWAGPNETAQSLPHYEEVVCDFELERPRKVVCGVLTILENRSSDSRREVTIPVVTFLSNDDVRHEDPVVYVPGGPGFAPIFSAVQLVTTWPDLLNNADWLVGRDLIVFDPRGTGMATPNLDCPEEKAQIEALSFFEDPTEFYQACFEKLRRAGIDLHAYHTPALAADLNELRRAIGIEAWNIWASSYGTRVALEAMRQDEQGIRSVILDAPYPTGVDDPVVTTRNFDRILTELIATCPLNDLCAHFGPDVPTMFQDLLKELQENPRELKMLSNHGFLVRTYEIDDSAYLNLLFRLTYRHRGLTSLPFVIIMAEQGSFSFGGVQPGDLLEISPYTSLGAKIQIKCADVFSVDPKRVEEASALFPYLADWTEKFWTKVQCRELVGPQEPVLDPSPVESDLPVLLLAGAFDPITPSQWAHDAAESLPNSSVFVFPGASHGVSPLRCARTIIRKFLQVPDGSPSDPCFARESGPVPY